jgi:hypothetical protein
MEQEVARGTVIQSTAQSNDDRPPRWSRIQRAELFDQYLALHATGLSLRQAAKALEVPRSTLPAWRAYYESLDEPPAVVAFFHSAPGLAFLHRLVSAILLVYTEVGAGGIRLVCLLLTLTSLDRWIMRGLVVAAVVMASGNPSPIYAHAFSQRYTPPLPFWLFSIGVAMAVILSFALIGLFVRVTPDLDSYPRINLLRWRVGRWVMHPTARCTYQLLSVGLFVLVVLAGLLGSQYP